jgi:CarD family transcriptional regulator
MAKAPTETVIGDGTFKIGDRVVYPKQGICRIVGVETNEVAGQKWEFVTLTREEDSAKVKVLREKVMNVGLRKVANVELIDEMFDYLTSPSDDPQLDWKVRHRENDDKMSGGGLFGTAEVLKGLHALTRVRPLPQKERELYDNARHLLVNEIAAACNVPLHVAENNLDYALFPPPGMKRKGRELKLMVVAVAAARPLREDDDLGFDDELEEETTEAGGEEAAAEPAEEGAAAPKAAGKSKLRAVPGPEEEGDEPLEAAGEEEEPLPKPAAKAKPAKAEKAAPKAEKPAAKAKEEPKHAEKHEPKHAEKHEPKHADKHEPKHADKHEPKHADKHEPKHADKHEPKHGEKRAEKQAKPAAKAAPKAKEKPAKAKEKPAAKKPAPHKGKK